MRVPPTPLPCGRQRDISLHAHLSFQLRREIAVLRGAGKDAKAYRLRLAYLNRSDMKTWAAIRALPARASDRSIERLAESINAFERQNEVVRWETQRKRSGQGTRHICKPGPKLRGASYLIKDVLEANLLPGTHIYDGKGRGRDAAVRDIKYALEAGYTACFVGDVRDCYQHVQPDNLAKLLPLPRALVEHCLDYRNLTLREIGSNDRFGSLYSGGGARWNGPRGLLQGLPSSSIVLATLFNDLVEVIVPHDCRVILYGDNLFVGAKDNETILVVIALIRDYFHEHPAGPFDLNGSSKRVYPEDGFEFLSYFLSDADGSAEVDFSARRWSEAEDAIDRAIGRDIARGDGFSRDAEEVIRDRFSGFRAINRWQTRLEERIDEAEDEIEDAYYERFIGRDIIPELS